MRVRFLFALCRSMPLYVLLVLLPAASMAQDGTAIVSGRLLNDADGSPIGFATVRIETAKGQPLPGVLTGENGRFAIRGLAPGNYTIEMSFPGFYPAEADIVVSKLNLSYDLGDVRLPPLEIPEQEITVTANAITARLAGVDTEVFRLDEGPTQSTGSLLDAMRNLPGVTVDEEGQVSLRGSNQVAILIDGR